MLTDWRPSLAESVTEITTPASVSSATPDDTKTDERTQRRKTPWSPETDGSLLLHIQATVVQSKIVTNQQWIQFTKTI